MEITHLCHYTKIPNNLLNLYINYPIILLWKVKVTPKFKSKLYNYNKILKCTNMKFQKITISIIINILFMLSFIKNITHDMCHHIFMYDGRNKNTNSQTNYSIKYISNIHGGVM